MLLEVDEEVKDFVGTLKDWPLKWLLQDGRALLNLSGVPAGGYYGPQMVRFFTSQADSDASSSDDAVSRALAARNPFSSDEDWQPLPRHSLV